MPNGTCALCKSEAELETSHLISRFVAKRQKADSPSRFLRDGRQPNRRVQDAPKEPLLCRKCEERFSDVESAFSREIFTPTMDGMVLDDVVVTQDHHRFCASIAWRNLAITLLARDRQAAHDDDYSYADWVAIENVEQALRQFLLGEARLPSEIQFHLFCARSTTETNFPGVNALVNLTTGFAMRARTDAPGRLYSIAFLNGLLLITLISSDATCRAEWVGGSTAVVPGALWRNHHQEIRDAQFGGILIAMAQEFVNARETMSARQRAVISKALEGVDRTKWAQSPHGKAVLQDYLNKIQVEQTEEYRVKPAAPIERPT